jgi:AcrR family transcriptional regulator
MTSITRAPGRPRSLAADEAILEATVELFAEVGLEALTVEGVAARAGVGKNTIYRRYPTKLDLVLAAVRCYTRVDAPPPDTGTTRGDVRALVDGLVAILTETPLGRMVPILVTARARIPELDAAHREIVAEKRARSAVVVERGIERGDFRADVDVDVVIDAFVSPIFYRFLVTNAPLDEPFRADVVDNVMRAFGP